MTDDSTRQAGALSQGEIEVTPQMIEAGMVVLETWLPEAARPVSYAQSIAERVFNAMISAARP
jgi:hypothetical protein